MRSIRTAFVALILGLLLTTLSKPAIPSVEIAEARGAMGLSQALKRLDVVGSVLHTGAHPDDENSALLAWLGRGEGVRTAYLSATRGEGGVNFLGPELLEELGVIRTEELYGARRLDHVQQLFTPNYEFGFSKSAEDTFTKWPHDQVLGDFVPGIPSNVGQFDPDLGRSYNQIASEGRSLHRSQAQGSAQDAGPRQTRLQLVQKTVTVADDAPLFAGVIYKLPDLAQLDPGLASSVNDVEQRITAIRQKVNLARPSEIAPDLAAALKILQQAKAGTASEHAQFLLQQKEDDFQEALRLASSLVVDVVASDDTVVPGQEFNLTVSVINGGPFNFAGARSIVDLPEGWTITPDGATGSIASGQRLDQKYKVKAAATSDFTQPYWLRQPRRGDRFVWPDVPAGTLPMDTVLLRARVETDYEGVSLVMKKPAEFRRVDRMLGEQRTAVKVVPALSVSVSPDIAIVPLKGLRKKEFA